MRVLDPLSFELYKHVETEVSNPDPNVVNVQEVVSPVLTPLTVIPVGIVTLKVSPEFKLDMRGMIYLETPVTWNS